MDSNLINYGLGRSSVELGLINNFTSKLGNSEFIAITIKELAKSM
jgi:hypothetical protein